MEFVVIVDIHSHYVSRELIAEARRDGASYGVEVLTDADGAERLRFANGLLIRPFFPQLCNLDVRLAEMDRLGVDVHVISTWMDVVGYWLPDEQGRRWARLQNETIARACQQHPRRLWPMGTLPMQNLAAALEELDYCRSQLGMRAVQIGTSINGRNLDEDQFRPFWAAVQEADVFVFLHPPIFPMGVERMDRYFLNNITGNPIETTVCASRLIFGGVLDAYPRLKCCLAHAGGFLPYQIGRLDRGYQARPECRGIAAPPSRYLDRFYYDSIAFDDRVLAFLLQMVPAERVLYGSDFPFPIGDPDSLARAQRAPGLTQPQRQGVIGANAARALGYPLSPAHTPAGTPSP